MGTLQGRGVPGGATNKITKARSKVVKPILKKLSHSEKNSLDLDRDWDNQLQNDGWTGAAGAYEPAGRGVGRTAKDVSFSFATTEARGHGGRPTVGEKEGVITGSSSNVVRKPFQHGRSQSGNSVATNGSGGLRAGSFVHPFQQMPRTSTPPLSYANSLASFENNSNAAAVRDYCSRDYSPTITEDEHDWDSTPANLDGHSLPSHLHFGLHQHHSSFSSSHQPILSPHSSTFSPTGLRRPSIASQRTSSLTDITSAIPSSSNSQPRTSATGRSTPSTSRLAPSKSDLHLNLTLSELESPIGTPSGTSALASAATAPAASLTSPSSASIATPMSPLRTSLEAMGIPRLRSRSEVDSAARQEQIRLARRKFEERERAKEEKYDREQVEKRNRQATKEAARIEKETAQWYKATGVSGSSVSGGGGSGGVPGSSSVNGSSVNVNLSESILQAPQPVASTKTGHRPSASRRTTQTSIATAASVSAGPTGRSVGAGVFGGRRKGSFGLVGAAAAGSRSDILADAPAPNGASSRKNSGFGKEKRANVADAEKGIGFITSNYDTLPDQLPPRFGASIDDAQGHDWRRTVPRRPSAIKKTQTYWQGFVLWLRTKIFRLSRR